MNTNVIKYISCNKCNDINFYKYLKNLNYFLIFNINPPNYKINLEKLSKNYKKIQKKIHPDICNKKYAEDCSSLIINAYNILNNDIKRAEYLLKLNKIETKENEINNSNEQLIKLYNIQEKILNNNNDENIKIKNKIIEKNNILKNEIANNFDNKNYKNIPKLLNSIRYNNRIILSINKKLNLL